MLLKANKISLVFQAPYRTDGKGIDKRDSLLAIVENVADEKLAIRNSLANSGHRFGIGMGALQKPAVSPKRL